MRFALVLIAVLVAVAVASQDAQASTHTGLQWSYGHFATSEYLKMAPAHVVRTEWGYVVVARVRPVIGYGSYKVMGEGETNTPVLDGWIIQRIRAELWEREHPPAPTYTTESEGSHTF
jgi:hypothetical protein